MGYALNSTPKNVADNCRTVTHGNLSYTRESQFATVAKPAALIRAIEVLVDQDVVRSGRAATEPWKFYDLGHGYCTLRLL